MPNPYPIYVAAKSCSSGLVIDNLFPDQVKLQPLSTVPAITPTFGFPAVDNHDFPP